MEQTSNERRTHVLQRLLHLCLLKLLHESLLLVRSEVLDAFHVVLVH